ncbi:hypothetical protein [Aurantimonas sp. 22II-16-19i]|nr:hypothetical protein [Aurantimonas sp. 22II-16-19i]
MAKIKVVSAGYYNGVFLRPGQHYDLSEKPPKAEAKTKPSISTGS